MDKNKLKDDLSNYHTEDYVKSSVSIDLALCAIIENKLKVLLIKRKYPPCRNSWALSGGFINLEKDETFEETISRVLQKETNLKGIFFEQLKTYGTPERDPRTRVITIAYYALIPYEKIKNQELLPMDDALELAWFDIRQLPDDMAFDHREILNDLIIRLEGKISYTPIAFNLVPEKFTWKELQDIYETILGEKLITPNFRRKIKEMYKIQELNDKKKSSSPGRPGVLLKYCGQNRFYS